MALRSTFMGFETASRGLMINQKAMDIVGNNVANIGVTGYTRQRLDQISMALNFKDTRFVNQKSLAGQGATIAGISQIRDQFLDKRFREEYGDVGYYQTISTALKDVDSALQEIEPEQMMVALSEFRQALGEMFKNSGSDGVSGSAVRANASVVAQVMNQLYVKLDNVWEQQYFDLSINVDEANKKLASIAAYNNAIRLEQKAIDYSNHGYYGPNELIDQRNVLLDDLSSFGDVEVIHNLDGTVDVKMNGHMVVKDDTYEQIILTEGNGENTVRLNWSSTGESIHLKTGILKASTDLLNGRGLNAKQDRDECTYNGILFYQDKINNLATVFAKEMNNIIIMADEEGNPLKDKDGNIVYKKLFDFGWEYNEKGEKVPREENAKNIQIVDEWQNEVSYLYDGIDRDGMEDTNYLEPLIDKLFGKDATVSFGNGEFVGSFTGYVTYYTTTLLGTQTSAAEDRLSECTAVSNNLLDRIASTSGVNLNEEAADQMMYQKAYDAMSRVMTAMDDLLDKLINGTGRCGL